jgi:hypothetical protein
VSTAIARVFAEKLKEIGRDMLDSPDFRRVMTGMLRQRELYVLSTYRNYDPLLWLLEEELSAGGIVPTEVTVPSLMAQLSGQNTANSVFLRFANDGLIYWQTATEAGKVHKVKELGARFRSTRTGRSGVGAVCERTAASRIFLVVDGEWEQADLDSLARTGLKGIYYPDQLDGLVRELKPASSPKIVAVPGAGEDVATTAEPGPTPTLAPKRENG